MIGDRLQKNILKERFGLDNEWLYFGEFCRNRILCFVSGIRNLSRVLCVEEGKEDDPSFARECLWEPYAAVDAGIVFHAAWL